MLASIFLSFLISFYGIIRPDRIGTNIFLTIFSADTGQFSPGEELEYDIYYHRFFLTKKIAEATAKIVEETQIRGHKYYHLFLRVKSVPFPIFVPDFNWKYHSYVTKEKLITQRYEKWITSEGKTEYMLIEFNQKQHLAHFPDSTIEILPETRDWISALYLTRKLYIASLKQRDILFTDVIEEDKKEVKRIIVKIKEAKREELKIGKKKYNCYYFKVSCLASSSVSDKTKEKELEIWFTKTDRTLFKINYGCLTIERKNLP